MVSRGCLELILFEMERRSKWLLLRVLACFCFLYLMKKSEKSWGVNESLNGLHSVYYDQKAQEDKVVKNKHYAAKSIPLSSSSWNSVIHSLLCPQVDRNQHQAASANIVKEPVTLRCSEHSSMAAWHDAICARTAVVKEEATGNDSSHKNGWVSSCRPPAFIWASG